MEFHHKFPEKVVRELTMWYNSTLVVIGIVFLSMAAAQIYTVVVTRYLQKKCVFLQASRGALQGTQQSSYHSDVDASELVRIFAEVCNRLPYSMHLTKLTIKPGGTLLLQGTIENDPHALTGVLSICNHLGFTEVVTVKSSQESSHATSFEVAARVSSSQVMHNMVYS